MKTPHRPQLGRDYPPSDEAADIDAILTLLQRQYDHDYPPGKLPARRDQHPKAHGCVRAQFTITDDVPAELRHGIFAEPRTYDAWIRFSSSSPLMTPDTKRDAHGMAIKLVGVPGEKVLEDERNADTQDFILANSHAFFVRNTQDYVHFLQAFTTGRVLSFFFGVSPFRLRLREFSNMLLAVGKRVTNPLQIRYWSQTPYRLGPHAVKYSTIPHAQTADSMPNTPEPDFLREAMIETLRQGEAVFDFLVQAQTDPVRMPVEDSTVVWDENFSPFRRVAIIRIPAQEIDTAERREFAENLSYNPWHSLPAHQPLGCMNRVRRSVYEMISRLRHERNGVPRE
ncbi:MAG: catalase family protein [Armatimonadota bacterium]|nr:catalase family protein [Armatimonadota bacterium]